MSLSNYYGKLAGQITFLPNFDFVCIVWVTVTCFSLCRVFSFSFTDFTNIVDFAFNSNTLKWTISYQLLKKHLTAT